MASSIQSFSKDELTKYLEDKGLEREVIDTIKKNRITGATFMELTPEHLKELLPVIGDRIALSKIINELKGTQTKKPNKV